jgi:hypothetical protein
LDFTEKTGQFKEKLCIFFLHGAIYKKRPEKKLFSLCLSLGLGPATGKNKEEEDQKKLIFV